MYNTRTEIHIPDRPRKSEEEYPSFQGWIGWIGGEGGVERVEISHTPLKATDVFGWEIGWNTESRPESRCTLGRVGNLSIVERVESLTTTRRILIKVLFSEGLAPNPRPLYPFWSKSGVFFPHRVLLYGFRLQIKPDRLGVDTCSTCMYIFMYVGVLMFSTMCVCLVSCSHVLLPTFYGMFTL